MLSVRIPYVILSGSEGSNTPDTRILRCRSGWHDL